MQIHQQLWREAIGIEDVTVVDIKVANTATDLIFRNFQTEFLFLREGEFFQNKDIAVILRELSRMIDHVDRSQLNSL